MLRWASAEPTWTIVPRFRGSIRWSAAIVPWTVPRYVTSVARRNSSAVRSANLENTVAIALLTQTSIGPSSASTCSAARSTASASATSVGIAIPAPTSAWAASRPSDPRASRPTLAPRSANARAAARPTPAEAPVTTTTCARLPLSLLLLGMARNDRAPSRFVDQLQHSHPVGEHDRAAKPASEGQEREPDQRQDQPRAAHGPIDVIAVADNRREQEEHRRGDHGGEMKRGGAPQRRASADGKPVGESRQRRRPGHDQACDQRQPPCRRKVLLAHAELGEDCERSRDGVDPDRGVGQRRMERMAGEP